MSKFTLRKFQSRTRKPCSAHFVFIRTPLLGEDAEAEGLEQNQIECMVASYPYSELGTTLELIEDEKKISQLHLKSAQASSLLWFQDAK
jgi:hypothetical protein